MFNYYSKWSNKRCSFVYHSRTGKIQHSPPNITAKNQYDRETINHLPWKESAHWMQFVIKAYDKIKPVLFKDDSAYQIIIRKDYWSLTFEDEITGDNPSFEWDGKGLDDKSIRRTD